MKIKVLAIIGLAAIAGLAGCKSTANTNTVVVTNTNTMNTMATNVVKTGESATVDPNMKSKVEAALKAKGFNDVTVDTSGGKMTIRGTVAKGKMAEVNAAAMEANGGKPVDNQVTEK